MTRHHDFGAEGPAAGRGTVMERIWRGRTTPSNADRYLRHVTQQVLPSLQCIDGFTGLRVLRRSDGEHVEFLVISCWESVEAVSTFAGSESERAVIAPEAVRLLAEYDSFVRHFDVAFESS